MNSYRNDAISFMGTINPKTGYVIERKHRALLIQGQLTPVHREDRTAGFLQNDSRSVVVPRRGPHGHKHIRLPGGDKLTVLGYRVARKVVKFN